MKLEQSSFVMQHDEYQYLLALMHASRPMMDEPGDAVFDDALNGLAAKKFVFVKDDEVLIDQALYRVAGIVVNYKWEAELTLPVRKCYIYVGEGMIVISEMRHGLLTLTPYPDMFSAVQSIIYEYGPQQSIRIRFSDGENVWQGDIAPQELVSFFDQDGLAEKQRSLTEGGYEIASEWRDVPWRT